MQCRMIMSQSISLNLPFPPLFRFQLCKAKRDPGDLQSRCKNHTNCQKLHHTHIDRRKALQRVDICG